MSTQTTRSLGQKVTLPAGAVRVTTNLRAGFPPDPIHAPPRTFTPPDPA